VELVGEVGGIAPGQPFWVALYQRISPGWHTYWVNPGDSGEPPRVEWAVNGEMCLGAPAGIRDECVFETVRDAPSFRKSFNLCNKTASL